MIRIITGTIVAGYLVPGLFFLKFWTQARDRLFTIFATAFWVLGAQRLWLGLAPGDDEHHVWLYIVHLLAFLLILGAILDKNRARDGGI